MDIKDLGTEIDFLAKIGDDYEVKTGTIKGFYLNDNDHVSVKLIESADGQDTVHDIELAKTNTSDEYIERLKATDLEVDTIQGKLDKVFKAEQANVKAMYDELFEL